MVKCDVKGCEQEAIGEETAPALWGGYQTFKVCEDHAWECLKQAKSGESGHGIDISWKRY